METRRDIAPGVDIRGDGGYIVAWPSVVEGRQYNFAPSLGLDDAPYGVPSQIPADWMNGHAGRPIPRELPEVIYDGEERWRHLASFAGTLRNRGLGEAAIVEQLALYNRRVCRPPKSDADVRRIARGVVQDLAPPPGSATRATLQHPPDLASDQRILPRFVRDIRRCGAVGEERNAQVVYLSITSRLLAEPVSVAIKGVSSGGKSYTIDRVADFFPPEALVVMTGMSEHALIYWPEDDPFAHRTIVLFEATALREGRAKSEENQTAYYVRSLLSEGRLRYPVTTKSKGKLRTEIITKDGPTNLVLSTTAVTLHPENETRVLSLQVDDSAAQTGRVLEAIATRRAKISAVDLGEWHRLQQWLAGAEHRVVVPFALDLARAIPKVAVRLRRDFGAVLGLIEAHALLHQLNRDQDAHGRIVATGPDYHAVRLLVEDLISEGLGATVSKTMRETVQTVEILAGAEGMDVGKVARSLDLDKSTVSRRLRAARERGYLHNLEDRRGRPARYVVGDPLPDAVEVLPRVLRAPESGACAACGAETAGQGECCSVAVDADPLAEEE